MKNLIFILFVFLFIQCERDKSDNGKYCVSGYIYSLGKPLINATISLDNSVQYQTQSDNNGFFEIKDVPAGKHTLKAQSQANDSYSLITSDINVDDNIFLQSLKLPNPIKLENPSEISHSSMKLYWNSSDAGDFREYKLFRHNSSGLDETTGELIHVSTDKKDTMFVDKGLNPNCSYFYRVYVMNDFGKLGGSNIVNDTTLYINYIPNGKFDDQTDLFWTTIISSSDLCKYAEYTTLDAVEGACLHIVNDTITPSFFNSYTCHLNRKFTLTFPILKNTKYKLSCWIKEKGKAYSGGTLIYGSGIQLFKPSSQYLAFIGKHSISETPWTYYETLITPTENYYTMRLAIGTDHAEAWFDNLKLELIK